ncbi:MAG: hypothetical protein Q9174_003890 [Haloplaca sp. 1 TL-2023]
MDTVDEIQNCPNGDRKPGLDHAKFTDLPVDILRLIVGQLRLACDKRSLLLTCKDVYETTLPELYRKIDLEISVDCHPTRIRRVNYKVAQMMDPHNRGLAEVKDLRLFDLQDHYRSPRDIYEYPEIVMLVYTLPENILRKFGWYSAHALPPEIYRTLLRRQKALTEVQLYGGTVSIDECVGLGSKSLLASLKNVEKLHIMPGHGEAMPGAACAFFQANRGIRKLILDLSYMQQTDYEPDDAFEASYTSIRASKMLLKGLEPSSIPLRYLELVKVNLKGANDEWMTVLELGALRSLSLISCRHSEDFLMALNNSAGSKSLHLKFLTIYYSQDPNDRDAARLEEALLGGLGTLLDQSVGELNNLHIILRGFDTLPEVAPIAQHGKTLKWLFIDVREQKGPWAISYDIEDWQLLCKSLEVVEQLDVTYPNIIVDRFFPEEDRWRAMRCTLSIPTLRTIGINNWPFPHGTEKRDLRQRDQLRQSLRDQPFHTYKLLLSGLASKLLDTRDRLLQQTGLSTYDKQWKSPIIMFGLCERLSREENWGFANPPQRFARSVVRTVDGQEKLSAEPISSFDLGRHADDLAKQMDIDLLAHDFGKFEIPDF